MYAQAIHQAVVATYLQPLQALIERRGRYYLTLMQKDPFVMSEEDAKKWQQRLQEIGQEIETLENIRAAISDLHEVYQKQLENAETSILHLRDFLHKVTLDYITFRQLYESEAQTTKFLLNLFIEKHQKSRAA